MPKKTTAQPRRTKTADKTPTPRVSKRGPALATARSQPTELEIAEGAYYRYLERTRVPKNELNDWLDAERELQTARRIG